MRFRYTGSGEHYSGIPASDLSDAQYAALDEDQLLLVLESGLYETVKAASRAERAEAAKAEKGD